MSDNSVEALPNMHYLICCCYPHYSVGIILLVPPLICCLFPSNGIIMTTVTWDTPVQSNQFNWHNIMDNWKSAQRFKIYNIFTSSSSWTDGYSLVWNGLICFCVIYGGEVADGCVLCRQHTGIWDLGYTLVHDVSTSLENVHWHPPSQHQLQRALRLGQWYPMKILLHSCKYSAGVNRTIC